MITYLFWAAVVGLAVAVIVLVGVKLANLKAALAVSVPVLVVGWAAYYFYLQQVFVKRWGGVMAISVPEGQHHIAATWKDDNLWVETQPAIDLLNNDGMDIQVFVYDRDDPPLKG